MLYEVPSVNMEKNRALYFRDELRKARARSLADAEDFMEILFVVESLGMKLAGREGTLGRAYKSRILDCASKSSLANEIPAQHRGFHIPFQALYELVTDGRNDSAHQGAHARRLTAHTIELALVLEDALMSNYTMASDVMATEPIRAGLWQPVSFLRQKMLLNSFSFLPALVGPNGTSTWKLVSDRNVARYLRRAKSSDERSKLLATELEQAISDGLDLTKAHTCGPETNIAEVAAEMQDHPWLVVKGQNPGELLGILTAFDLL